MDGCKQLLEKGMQPLDNKLDVLVNNAGQHCLDTVHPHSLQGLGKRPDHAHVAVALHPSHDCHLLGMLESASRLMLIGHHPFTGCFRLDSSLARSLLLMGASLFFRNRKHPQPSMI